MQLKQEPTAFLSTIQAGITGIGILNGIVGEAAFAPALAGWLSARGFEAGSARLLSTGLVVLLITYGKRVDKVLATRTN